MKKTRIGFVGVGCISGIYLQNITHLYKELEIAGVCDLVREKAENASREYGVRVYQDMYELFADPSVDIVLNITRPNDHYEVTKAALEAGKHVYSEKPLATCFEKGVELVKLAKERGLMLGGAPDTFMGAGLQTSRKLIDEGFIGTPTSFHAHMLGRGPESWHPDPEFFYKPGGGPMMDMGPYYVTALVNMLGRADKVAGLTTTPSEKRIFTCKEHFGETTKVETPTTIAGLIHFENGVIGTIQTSFDTTHRAGCALEIFGTEGTLYCPDPNTFGGDVVLHRRGEEPKVIPLCFNYRENSRAAGLADMAKSIETGKSMRAGCQQTLHVLEIMTSIIRCGDKGEFRDITSPYTRPEPMKWTELEGIIE